MKTHSFHSRAGGFTLVELLVSLAIVAVLAGLICLGVRSALASSRSATCLSNLRRLSALSKVWTADHQGEAMPAGGAQLSDTDANYFFWRRLLLNQMDGKWDKRGLDAYAIMARMKGADYDSIMWCPGYVAQYGKSQGPQGRGSYSINYFFRLLSVSVTKVPALSPASEPYMICGSPFWTDVTIGAHHSFSTLKENGTYNGYGGAAYFHEGHTHMLFYDGHVMAATPAEAAKYETDVRDRTNF